MGLIYDQAVKFFQDDGWLCRADGETAFRTTCRGVHGEWACAIHTREEPPQVVMYSEFSFPVPAGKRAAAAEYLMRANDGLVIGNFELDVDTGEVRYKTSVDAGDAAQVGRLLRPLVYANVRTMAQYWPGLLAVVYQNLTPSRAIESVESAEATLNL